MTLLTLSEQQQVVEAIDHVERETDAELVTVLAEQADDYRYIPLLWAGLIALVVPGAAFFFTAAVSAWHLLLVQWATFIVLALAFGLPSLTTRLIPRQVRQRRACNPARRQFIEGNLHHTEGGTGILIFVSEAE